MYFLFIITGKTSNAVHRHRRHSDYEYSYDHLEDNYGHEEEHDEQSGNEASVQDDVIPLKDSNTRKRIFRTDHQSSRENSESSYEEANLLEEEDYEDNYDENQRDDNYNSKLGDNNYDGYFENNDEQSKYTPNNNKPEDGYNDEQLNDISNDEQPVKSLDGYDKYNEQDFQDQDYIGRANRNDDDVFKDVERGFIDISSATNEEDDDGTATSEEDDDGTAANEKDADSTATNVEDAENNVNVESYNNVTNTNPVLYNNVTVSIGDDQDKKNFSVSNNKENTLTKTDIINVFDGSNDKKDFNTAAAEQPMVVHEGGNTYTLLPWKGNSTKGKINS